LKLNLSSLEFSKRIEAKIFGSNEVKIIDTIVYDSRKIIAVDKTVFFAFVGDFRNGHSYIDEVYQLGVRLFVVSEKIDFQAYPDAQFHVVSDTLISLQMLAQKHRLSFSIPIIGITGSVGKTTVKEWIYHLLCSDYKIVRSPKSYNSQLGVALSLLEITNEHNLALIEAGISKVDEMEPLQKMIQATYGVFTAFGNAHTHNFISVEQHLNEKEKLFVSCKKTFVLNSISINSIQNCEKVDLKSYEEYLSFSPFQDKASLENLSLALAIAIEFGVKKENLIEKIKSLPRLALRMETFEGKNGNIIINDSYNADLDALQQSLEYQKSIANSKKRTAILGIEGLNKTQIQDLKKTIHNFKLDQIYYLKKNEIPPLSEISNQVVLIKGTRSSQIQQISTYFQLKKHKTRIEINLTNIRENILFWKNQLHKNCKLLVMVKASSYGAGAEKMTDFLEKSGVDYLGVAYVDEGVELRKNGIKLPILVMNADEDGFHEIIEYKLEPSIFSFTMLESFIKVLINFGKEQFPIHLKFDTGMKRLGFEAKDVHKVIDVIQTQPEVKIQSIYSHLADSDNLSSQDFTRNQISIFEKINQIFEKRISYPYLKHLLNSEAITQFPEAQFDMVRLGIGLYGISVNPKIKKNLKSGISWKSVVSQIKTIESGESVGYSRTFIATKPTQIAIIPVGYADGFKRNLSQGVGGVFIKENYCFVLGNVCMDMIMVDVSNLNVQEGDEVEIIGQYQSIEELAKKMQTIPYEVLTSLSKRLHRVYIEE
jgi:alanine racemase